MDHTKSYGIKKWYRAFCNQIAMYLVLSFSVCTPVALGLEDCSHFQVAGEKILVAGPVVMHTPPPLLPPSIPLISPVSFPPPPKPSDNKPSPPSIAPVRQVPTSPLPSEPVGPPRPPPPPPSGSKTWNESQKAGVVIASLAALLQVAVIAFLLIKRRQMLSTVEYGDNLDPNYRHPESV